mgnify:CR=1 FL=1
MKGRYINLVIDQKNPHEVAQIKMIERIYGLHRYKFWADISKHCLLLTYLTYRSLFDCDPSNKNSFKGLKHL